MANDCSYDMKIVGAKTDLDEFLRWMNAGYDEVENPSCTEAHHFWRVFEAVDSWDGDNILYINGSCAWSVASCFTESGYQESHPNSFGITLQQASKELELDIEVYSTEPGMGFAEHYLYKHGEGVNDEESEYQEIYKSDYETKEEAEECLGRHIDNEEWNNNEDYLYNCEWDPYNIDWEI